MILIDLIMKIKRILWITVQIIVWIRIFRIWEFSE